MIPGSPLSRTLVFRADASVSMGTGHVMRCLALAQAWQDAGGRAVFAMAEAPAAVRARVLTEGVEVAPIEATAAGDDDARGVKDLARHYGAGWVVLDGYHFGTRYQREVNSGGPKVLLLDDDGFAESDLAEPSPVDLILNQNANATESMYARRGPYGRLLLGTQYALLRREFAEWKNWERKTTQTARHLLITMGGSDPDNLTSLVIKGLSLVKTEGVRSTIVAGGSNPHFGILQSLASSRGGTIQLHERVSNMPELMAQADIAIIAAGGTLWELLYMSCPVLSFARNPVQGRILDELRRSGVVHTLGDPKHVETATLALAIDQLAMSPERRASMSKLGRLQVDGEGARRVCEILAAPERSTK
jgi:UDP-2,4-diacetamido-2,4,6-trideoxy-beta-L-altropyranose hydrolase